MFGSKILVERKNWLCLVAKFGVERKKGEGALERERKKRGKGST